MTTLELDHTSLGTEVTVAGKLNCQPQGYTDEATYTGLLNEIHYLRRDDRHWASYGIDGGVTCPRCGYQHDKVYVIAGELL